MALERKLGLAEIITICVGTIVGSGIYFLPIITVLKHGLLSSLIGWVVGGITCLFISISMAVHTKKSVGVSGGPVSQAYCAFGNKVGYITGWSLWISYIASLATLSVAFSDALLEILGLNGFFYHSIIAIGILLVNLVINLLGVKIVGKLQNIITLAKIIPIIIFIFACFFFLPHGGAINFGNLSFFSVGAVAAITVWAYTGFEAGPIPSEETKKPKRNIPYGVLFGMIIVLALYLPVVFFVGSYLPQGGDFSGSLIGFSKNFLGFIVPVMSLGILLSVGGCLNGSTLVTSRILYGISREEKWKYNLKLNKFKIPYRTLCLQTLLSALLIFTGTFEQLALFTAFAYLIPYVISSASASALIKKSNELIFVPPGKYLIPLGGVILSLWLLYESFIGLTILQSIIAIVLIFSGFPIYYLVKLRTKI